MNFWWIGLIVLFLTLLAWPNLAWQIRSPFLWTNRLQWFLIAPYRRWMRDPRSEWPHRLFLLLSPLLILYRLLAYLLLAPLRLWNALYFDVLLFWSVALRDGIADLVHPPYTQTRFRYVLRWLYLFPWRLVRFLFKYPLAILQGLAMVLFDLLWPTLTLFHGSGYQEARTIARTGEWFAGPGNYVGTGLYFGLEEGIGRHYARTRRNPLVIVARVTLAPCRPIATLSEALRRQIGRDGDTLSRDLPLPWVSVEHWRRDRRWYEFCLMQPSQYDPTKPWRVRPLCTIGPSGPERLPGGTALWPSSRRGGLVLSASLLGLLVVALGYASWAGLLASPPSLAALLSPGPGRSSFCPDAPRSRLQVGERACVADIGADVLHVRADPLVNPDNVVHTISRGRAMVIVDGPACADGHLWWRVRLAGGAVGWVAEGQGQRYFLEPCGEER